MLNVEMLVRIKYVIVTFGWLKRGHGHYHIDRVRGHKEGRHL
jgi:hypothetical protein